MKRRQVLALGTLATGLPAWAQPGPGARAAVVIGVDKAGDLPRLRAAASGARQVARWLEGEGFAVTVLADETQAVTSSQVFGAVKAIVDRGVAKQLVIYFAGHGFINGFSEHWLLSGAPDNPNETVSLLESVVLARQASIPNVVFISDACRSTPDSLRVARLHGSLIFPSQRRPPAEATDVDQFLATLVGEPSWEVPLAESSGAYAGLYTSAFLDAFHRPDPAMVRQVDGKAVVPNAQLKSWLAREVPRRAQQVSIRLQQRPDTQVMSGEHTYIGRVLGTTADATASAPAAASAPATVPAPPPIPRAAVHEVARTRLVDAGLPASTAPRPALPASAVAVDARESGFDAAISTAARGRELALQFPGRSGFVLSGARVAGAVAAPDVGARLLGDAGTVLDIDLRGRRGASVAITFADGSGTLLAALAGFVGTVVIDRGGVVAVTYVPTRSSGLLDVYLSERARVERLQATVATAARFGVFRIEGPREQRNRAAAQTADRIRMLKGVDPTLGLYAAYAYADAGLVAQVRSVMNIMHGDLGTELFDVAMLGGALEGRAAGDRTVPFVPMLAQGWSLLRVKGVQVPEAVAALRTRLVPALWTTFDREGLRVVEAELRSGRVR